MARNPMRNKLAIVGIGTTPYGRDLQRTELSLGLEASMAAIEDAGIGIQEIDGICGSAMSPLPNSGAGFLAMQGALGIEQTTWVQNGWLSSCLVHAVQAVFAGVCDVALVVQTYTRGASMSRAAAADPFRARISQLERPQQLGPPDFARYWFHNGQAFAALMGRYMYEFGCDKDVFARVAINNRTHALNNPNAVMRKPLTFDEYHASPMIFDPMQLLDMDVPVDCGEAVIVTTAERARDLRQKPVYIHAMTLGGSKVGEHYQNNLPWTENAAWAAARGMWDRSELTLADMDLFFAYDGFSINTVMGLEAAGYCELGGAPDFLRSSWDNEANILRLNGRAQMMTHGGGLSQGRAGGFNFYTEAVRQLRGTEGSRQVADAQAALVTAGSIFHDPSAMVLCI